MKSFLLFILFLLPATWAQAQTADVSTTVSGPSIATGGTTVTYTIALFNNGPATTTINSYTITLASASALSNLSLTGAYAGTTYSVYPAPVPGVSSSYSYSASTQVGTLNITTSFPLSVADQLGGTLTFTMPTNNVNVKVACTSTGTTDPNANNNNGTSKSSNVPTTYTPNATYNLATTLGGPATVNVGQAATYSVITTNNGPNSAQSVVQTIQLPLIGTGTYPAAADVTSSGGAYSATTGLVNFPAVTTLTVSSLVRNTATFVPRAAGSRTATGQAKAASGDTDTANDKQIISTTVTMLGGTGGTTGACATPGRDNSPTALATNPNAYYPASTGAQTVAAKANSLPIGAVAATGAATPIKAGDLLLIIQMQGAAIDYTNSNSYGNGVAGGPGNGFLDDANFTAGRFEYVVAKNDVATTGGTLKLTTNLVNNYEQGDASGTIGQRRFQVVRVPQYTNLTLGADISPAPWNGTTGGVLVLDVAGALNLNKHQLDADGRGFRGGAGRQLGGEGNSTSLLYTDYVTSAGKATNGTKGEGIAGTPQYLNNQGALLNTGTVGYPGGDNGRGAPGNAGGGGTDGNPAANDQNSGGSGGSNGGDSGRGGNAWSSNLPSGGDPALGFGAASVNRLVLGGGGGAGTTNNGTGDTGNTGFASSGAAGGGLIIVRTGSVAGTGTISADGAAASTNVGNDGAGGGGAGGSILLTSRNTTGLSGLTLTADGGKGGTLTTASAHGPGGGGSGGIIITNAAVGSVSAITGSNGVFKTSATDAGVAYSAATGVGGFANTSLGTTTLTNSTAASECIADVATTITGPTTVKAGQATGDFTVTFANNGAQPAAASTRTVTLPAGATLTQDQIKTIKTNYPGTTFPTTGTAPIIDFGTSDAATLVSGYARSFVFAYTAPSTAGKTTTSSTSSTPTAEGGLIDNNAAGAPMTVTATPLPVELTVFTAQAVQNRDALLSWITATELDNNRFEIERSLDGVSFGQVGSRAGQGTKTTATTYTFTDASIGTTATGLVYYRLRQVDTDGTAHYSPVRPVSFTASASLSVYPNPAAATTQLDLRQLPAGTYQVSLLDLTGRVVLRQSVEGAGQTALSLDALASGSYLVQVTGNGLNTTLRLTRE
ncbi:MAG: beta strand repeat-containing protein [Janthinobacterium lividum]